MPRNVLIWIAALLIVTGRHSFPVKGQTLPGAGNDPETSFKQGNFNAALAGFLEKLAGDSADARSHLSAGICYLNVNGDKRKAIPHLETALRNEKTDRRAWYYLGVAYQHALRFDDAIRCFSRLASGEMISGEEAEEANRRIEMCHAGKELMRKPVDVTFEHLGEEINSEYPDFAPYAPPDESFLVFSSRRKGNTGAFTDADGFLPSDVYLSADKKEKFSSARKLTAFSTEEDEESAGLSPDGNMLTVFVDGIYTFGNIYFSQRRGKTFQPLAPLSENINTPTSMETAGSLSADQTRFYFSSDAKGGYGGTDLYVSRLLPDGTWGKPENLGASINTTWNEDYPFISTDGKTLWFSSQGHTNMGGYDLFKTTWNDEEASWTLPRNLGYPINTPDDNFSICPVPLWDPEKESESIRYAYISAWRDDSYGDLDIYRITFNETTELYTAITGAVTEKVVKDPNEYKTFFRYKRGGVEFSLPAECHPWHEPSLTFVDSHIVKVEPGYELKTILRFSAKGGEKIFYPSKYPKDPSYVLMETKTTKVRIKGYSPREPEFEFAGVKDVSISVTNSQSGEEYQYAAAPTGRYVIILSPGQYQFRIEASGFRPLSEKVTLRDKSGFVPEVVRDFTLLREEVKK